MTLRLSILVAALAMLTVFSFPTYAAQYHSTGSNRVVINFNQGWLFSPKNLADGQSISLNDSSFGPVCIPHTVTMVKHADFDTSLFAKVTWYRKHFALPAEYAGRRFIIEFQAVSKVAKVYVNGQLAGTHKGAYTPFSFDITDKVKTGADNVLAVQVDSRQHKEVPPEGIYVDYMIFGGIVRNVNMFVVDPVHVERVYVTQDTAQPNRVAVKANVVNNSAITKKCIITTSIIDTSNAVVATAEVTLTIPPDSSYEFSCVTSPVASPQFWHPDHPYLYTACMQLRLKDGAPDADEFRQKFGIRSIAFDKTTGAFSINGLRLKLRGLNRHETYPFIGRAAADRLQRKDADIIKYEFGCNIVRCSHYPQSPAFLDRCDEIGLLVLEEMPGWMYVSDRPEWQAIALKNIEDMIVRDRNHPSIISFGVRVNESSDFHRFYVKTNNLARTLDPGRPTHGVRVVDRGMKNEFLEDVWVYNYAVPVGTPPVMPWITGEHVGHRATTHSWDEDQQLNQLLAHAAVHDSAEANPKIAGLLGWCAFDYNSPYTAYSQKQVCYHGVADIFRIPKYAAWVYRSQADPALYGPMVFIAHSWKKALKPNKVVIASNCEKVELFVNNVSKGRRPPNRYLSLQHPLFVWNSLPFEPGELKAVGYIGNKAVATFTRRTPGVPVRLVIIPDDTLLESGGDMTRVVVSAVDSFGQVVPQTGILVTLSAGGAGDFYGESPVALENGTTVFFVKTRANQTGAISGEASGKNLTKAEYRIVVKDRK